MTTAEYKEMHGEKWEDVRPVVIYFGGEKFVIEYNPRYNPLTTPIVAMVHSYLDNLNLTKSDH
ncbi:MAG: hypothetical protein J7J85_07005 [Deltaproteobacteria bacterium]|nr:hypothetical protein [Deltaproteobacteria bacterium]